MSISLPEHLKEFVDRQVAAGRFSNASEYVSHLIQDDERSQERPDPLVLEGVESEATEMTQWDWDEIRDKALRRFEERKGRTRV